MLPRLQYFVAFHFCLLLLSFGPFFFPPRRVTSSHEQPQGPRATNPNPIQLFLGHDFVDAIDPTD
jgi:hypothetical protein